MPFTISHAAAVLPLQRITRSRIPLAALMIGSMSPDFSYFLPFDLGRTSTHDFDGMFMFCWPVGLVLWLLFVKLLERPTVELLPAAWRERIPRSLPVTPRALLLASLGILIGAMTHIAWDSFTHANTQINNLFPVLDTELFEFHGHPIRVYFVLQYASSVAGLLALAYWGYNLRHGPPPTRPARYQLGFLTDRARLGAALALIGTSAAVGLISFVATAGSSLQTRIFHTLVNAMIAWLLAWCLVAVMINQAAQRAPSNTRTRR